MKHKHYYALLLSSLLHITIHAEAPRITAEISYGELVDKITILEIKSERITDTDKLRNVLIELESLLHIFGMYIGDRHDILLLKKQLKETNEALWDVEDCLRAKEREKKFDNTFTYFSRCVYRINDKRCQLKKTIDIIMGSSITEEKLYEAY